MAAASASLASSNVSPVSANPTVLASN
jgi:hypothetical protein